MREIEFRAWHKKYEYMERVADISFNRGIVNLNASDISKIEDVELMQYTGIKDKNGVKIFEGDIVKLNSYLWKVYWINEEGCFKMKNKFDDLFLTKFKEKALELIGNIYENPELLEVDDE